MLKEKLYRLQLRYFLRLKCQKALQNEIQPHLPQLLERCLIQSLLLNLSVNKYAVIGGPIIKATTSIEPTASNDATAVIDTSDINI